MIPWIFKSPKGMTPDEYRQYLLYTMRIGNIYNRILYMFLPKGG